MRHPHQIGILLAASLIAACGYADDYILTLACGTEGALACTKSDKEYYGINYFVGKACDWGLKNDNGTCVNDTRRTITPGWLQWAMDEQRYGINAASPINQVTTFGTHNSFSTYNAGFGNALATDQTSSITDQLQAGARSIRIDGVFFDNEMRLCHGNGNETAVTGNLCRVLSAPLMAVPWSSGRLVAFAFDEVKKWLDDNPKQFIVLQMNGGYLGGASGSELMIALIKQYFGTKAVVGGDVSTDANGDYAWDSVRTFQNKGKQIIIFSFPALIDGSQETIAFSKSSLLLDAAPSNSNQLPSCTASGALTPIHSYSQKWSEFGEDRSGSAANETGFIGYVDEADVALATGCGYSLINVDFLNARKDTFPPSFAGAPTPSYASPDLRPQATLWTFLPGDYGQAGPAVQVSSTGYWSSDPMTTQHPYACAKPAASSPDLWTNRPSWVVTSNSGVWANGTAACPSGYSFSFPKNPRQNNDLRTAANGKTVWLNYHTSATGITLSPGFMVFKMQAGGTIPSPQRLSVTEWVPGSKLTGAVPATATWVKVPSSITVANHYSVDIQIKIDNSATSLASGVYFANVTFTGTDGNGNLSNANILVQLNVQEPTSVALAASPNPVGENSPVTFTAFVTSPSGAGQAFTGTLELREETSDPDTGAPVITKLATTNVSATGTAHFALGVLPNGSHKLYGVYLGNNVFQQSSSARFTLNVTPFFQPSPASVSKSFNAGSPPSGAAANVSFSWTSNANASVQTSCNGQQPCAWLQILQLSPAAKSIGAQVKYGPGAATLSVGQYQALVTISDGLHQSASVTFNLSVLGAISASPSTLNLIAAARQRVATGIQVSIPSGSMEVAASVTTSSGGNWLKAASGQAPGIVEVEANASNLKPGTYSGTIQLTSALASNAPSIQVQLVVVPGVTIGTSPTGLKVKVDGALYTAPATFAWRPGEHHILEAVPSIVNNGTEFAFKSWHPGSATTLRISIDAPSNDSPQTWTANYTTLYHLEADAVPSAGGTIQLSPAPQSGGYYAAGTPVQVTAVAATGYSFAGFSGSLSGTQNPQTLVMSGVRQISATFHPPVAPQ